MGLKDVAVGEMQPGQQDQLVPYLDAVEGGLERRVDVELRAGSVLEGLVRGVGSRPERRADDADRLQGVYLEGIHSRVRVLHARLMHETRPRRT